MLAIDWPAWVQAGSAVVIAALTVALVIATGRYVWATRAMADEMRRTNEMAERNTVRTLRREAASLRVTASDREGSNDEHGWRFRYLVENIGRGVAHGVVLTFDDREEVAEQSIPPGITLPVWVTFSDEESDPTERPAHLQVRSVTFQDPDDSWWVQTTRGGRLLPPEPLDDG